MAENYDFGDYRYQPLNFDIGGGGGGFTGTGGIGFQAPSIPDVGPGYNAGSYTPLDFSNLYAGGGGGFQLPQGAIPDLGGFQPSRVNIPQYIPNARTADAYTGAGFRMPGLPAGPVAAATGAPAAPAGQAPQNRNMLERAGSYLDRNPTLAKLLGGGLTAGLGSIMGARGQAAAGRLQKDIGKLGATQREEGQRLVAAAQRGELTAPQQQQLEAFRAQQAQALSSRGITGGTAAQQLDAQIENMRQQLLQQNLQTGLALLQVGDSYTQQAITAGYGADQAAQNTAGRFYSAALQTLGAMPAQQQTQQTRTA
jgi:hypothetical protein